MKTKIVKDIPIGILLLVLSFYCLYGVMYFAGFPTTAYLIGIVFMAHLGIKLVIVGFDLIFGIEMKDNK